MDRKSDEKFKDAPSPGEHRPRPSLRLVPREQDDGEPIQQAYAARESHPKQTCWDDDDPGPTAA